MAAFLGGDANTYYLDSPSLITTLESELGRSFAGFRMNYWPNDATDPRGPLDPVVTTYYNAGRKWVYLNGKPNPISSDGTYMQWSTVASGGYDSYFTWWFNQLKADTRWNSSNPLHISFHHEQYVTAEGGGALAGTPASYPRAFQHVRSIMDATGAHVSKGGNCLMCFVPHWLQLQNDPVYSSTVNTSSTSYTYRVSVIDPGAAYYDICGFDCYKSTNQSSTTSMSSMWTPFHKWAVAVGKPMMTGEWGLNHFSDSQIQTDLAALLTLLKGYGSGAGAGQLLMMTTTHRLASQGDYRWDINPTVLAAYKNFANDPFFAATVGGGGGGGGVTAPTSGAPTIDDTTPQTLEVIHALANDSSWDGTKPLDYSAQWQQAASAAGPWTNITTGTSTSVFTADTYSVPTGVAGQVLRARVTGSNLAAGGGNLTVNTAATSPVSTAPTPPTNSSPPVVSGTTLPDSTPATPVISGIADGSRTNSTSQTFTWTEATAGCTFYTQLDNDAWVNQGSALTVSYTNLHGMVRHRFRVMAVLGGFASLIAHREWDVTGPRQRVKFTTGTESALVIPVSWTGHTPTGTPSDWQTQLNTINSFYNECSWGAFQFNFTLIPQVTITTPSLPTSDPGYYSSIITAADAAASSAGFPPTSFLHVYYNLPDSGDGFIGATFQITNPSATDTIKTFIVKGLDPSWVYGLNASCHELGHSIGFSHANALNCGATTLNLTTLAAAEADSAGGSGNIEYGNTTSTMGRGQNVAGIERPGHHTGLHKWQAGWTNGNHQVVRAYRTGDYTVLPSESSAPGVKVLTFNVGTRHYWLEYRQPIGFDAHISSDTGQTLNTQGVLINMVDYAGVAGGSLDYAGNPTGRGPWLLDATPSSASDTADADTKDSALAPTRSFTDAGVTITTSAASSSGVTVTISGLPQPPFASFESQPPAVGDFLTATTGSWANSPASYSGEWQTATAVGGPWSPASLTNVSRTSFTGDTYHVTSSDVARFLRCRVTATNGAGSSAPTASAATSAVTTSPVVVSDTITTADGQHINEGQDYTVVWTASTNAPGGITSSQASLDGGAFVDGIKVADDGAGGGTWQITFTAPVAGTHTVVTRDIA